MTYVEWGQAGHERSEVAISVVVWTEGDFVVTDDSNTGVISSTVDVPMSSANWAAN